MNVQQGKRTIAMQFVCTGKQSNEIRAIAERNEVSISFVVNTALQQVTQHYTDYTQLEELVKQQKDK